MRQFNLILVLTLMVVFNSLKVIASTNIEDCVAKTTAVTSGVVIAPFFSTPRGFLMGAVWGTNSVAAALGNQDGFPHQVAGALTGGVVGGIAGGVAGLIKGPYDAIRYGIDRPFSKENFSRAGNDYLDYDPFDWTY